MQNSVKQYLIVSEQFYSIQGEGNHSGVPAVFLRLSGCNLDCVGFSKGCDTKSIWITGSKYSFIQIIEKWQKNGWLKKLQDGAHLILTGGEPLLQMNMLFLFIQQLEKDLNMHPYIELETNATILSSDKFLNKIDQINASPKLSNSGNSQEMACKPEVLLQLSQLNKTKFKFVIQYKEDIHEVVNKYVLPFNMNPNNIWLMPEGSTRQAIQKNSPMVVELCKRYMMNFSPRLQIDIWDQLSGV
jgi:7-carboxy-7-deazaguanine synthase